MGTNRNRGVDGCATSNVRTQKVDTARVKPHVEGNPHGEPQPRAAPRPHKKGDNWRKISDTSRSRYEDSEGYVMEVYDEGLD